jgi:TP901 family phage tail tape measure protein
MSNLAIGAGIAGKLILAGIGGAMVVSAKAAIDFESSLAGVAKTVDGTAEQIEAIGSSMRRLSLRVPVNVNELNQIAELGGQLGVEIPNLVEFTEVIAALGVTTNLSTEDAAKGLARLANVTGLTQDAYSNLGSIIVDLGNNFATTESEILTFALRIAPSAQTVGATADEVLGLAAALSSMGIPAERGGTAVQAMFSIIAAGARSGGDELLSMAAITGMTADEFADLAKSAPTDALVTLAKSFGAANSAGENVFAMMRNIGITGRRAQAVMLAMANNTDLLDDALERSSEAGEENVALFEEAARRYGTTASEIRLMANQFNDLRIQMGQPLIAGIRDVITFISAFFEVLRDNDEGLRSFVKTLGWLAVGLTALGLTAAIGKMVSFTTATWATVTAAGGLAATIGKVRLVLGLLGGAIGIITTVALGLFIKNTADAAAKLAQLKENAANFQLGLDTTGDEVDALTAVLQGLGDADPARLSNTARALELAGMGIDDLINAALAGPGAVEGLISELQDVQNPFQDLAATEPVSDEDIAKGLEMNTVLSDAESLARELGGTIEQHVNSRALQMALDFVAARGQAGRTFDEIEARARAFAQANPLATSEDFIGVGEVVDGWMAAFQSYQGGLLRADGSWQDFLLKQEGGADKLAQFYEDSDALILDWAEGVSEGFNDVTESIRSGFPAWDEYGNSAKVSLDGIVAAQDRFLADMQLWSTAQESLLGNVTTATLAWFDSLGPLEKGAFGRLFAKNREEFDKLVGDIEENLIELEETAENTGFSRLPFIIDEQTNALVPKMAALAGSLDLEDEFVMDAFEDGLIAAFTALPANVGPTAKEKTSWRWWIL